MSTIILKPAEWSIQHTPAANTIATITRAAVPNQIHVCKSITASLTGDVAATAAINVYLRDGLTGAGTIVWSCVLRAGITSSATVALTDLNIVGTTGNAMTLEFSVAGGAATFETVALTGFTSQ